MARLLRIERAITWIARSLTANRDANPTPAGVIDQILPNVDIFGSQRIQELQFEVVAGALGGIEVTHGPVDQRNVRQYLSMEYSHDDIANRTIQPGRIVPTASGFPFAPMRDAIASSAVEGRVVRNFTVGPGGFAAARTIALPAGARLTLTLLWVETPIGEYLRSIQ